VRQCDTDPGQQLITVVRKGSRAVQQVPASADAFVWRRLYQEELRGKVPRGRTQPAWWTLRQPIHPLTYHAAHRGFERANAVLGANWTLHDLSSVEHQEFGYQGSNWMSGKRGDGPSSRWLSRLRRYLSRNASM
jgi:hypothetical protein